ncbi:hypothetical protein [Niabella hibiscisoli]|uniref:hypothetical protein n=1 Tax=Niabella hibiscisoli TaxID=1825928 RepID=UPI001F0D32AC|nr:hypothetical protein [Niabella hibiscisoli]MCH5715160.1 hypothetical protein [Niabella hibiscisoli]
MKSVVRYSDSDLQEFKEIILRKLDAAKKSWPIYRDLSPVVMKVVIWTKVVI